MFIREVVILELFVFTPSLKAYYLNITYIISLFFTNLFILLPAVIMRFFQRMPYGK